ncbi:hypothetical protein Rsub_07389 [Raphidocelis subcapitata]|uniref:Uncharacterized protein n=1 Tax=Raphidocelis subcapitata TaxID=307507 RepID=A0A2V0P9S2_9CHLO|nr:hypothetical protein Rsub_07389 [Raphidocelis subcapitata]|eukprot:GBF94653.1 hypothetical protein Rsub_07389 [Raphidocelis subcapitata]
MAVADAPRRAARRPADIVSTACDAAVAVLVVAVQDVCFKEAVTACAALSAVSFACNWHEHARGRRVVFPKSVDLAIPAIALALVVPAWLDEEGTHRVVYVVICGGVGAVMLASVAVGRSFALEFYMDWYPRDFWGTPLVTRLTSHLAWAWIASQALMAGAALCVVFTGNSNPALYVWMNYVMQLVPLVLVVLLTLAYPWALKRSWGFDPADVTTAFHPAQRAALGREALEAAAAEAAEAAAARVGCFCLPPGRAGGGVGGGGGGPFGRKQRVASRAALLGGDGGGGGGGGGGDYGTGDSPPRAGTAAASDSFEVAVPAAAAGRRVSSSGGGGGGGGGGAASPRTRPHQHPG